MNVCVETGRLDMAALLATASSVPTGQAAPTAASMTQNADEALTQATLQQGSFASKSPPPGPTKLQPASYFQEKYAAYAKEQAAEAALAVSNPAAKTAAPAPEPTVQFYTGKPFDNDTGTYLFRFRNYNPATASWTTPDPSGFPDGPNNMRYAPVPTTGVDPTGLMTITPATGVSITGQARTQVTGTSWYYESYGLSTYTMNSVVQTKIAELVAESDGWWSNPSGVTSVTSSGSNSGATFNVTNYSNINFATPSYDAVGEVTIDGGFTSIPSASGSITGLIQIVDIKFPANTHPKARVHDEWIWDGSPDNTPWLNSTALSPYDTPQGSVSGSKPVLFHAYDFLATWDSSAKTLIVYPDGYSYGFTVTE